MKENINFSRFCDLFKEYNRDNNFSYEGKEVLFDYLNELGEDTGREIEVDIISICCDFSEYKNLNEYLNDYSEQHSKKEEFKDEDEFKQVIEDEIQEKTTLIKFKENLNEGFIIQQY